MRRIKFTNIVWDYSEAVDVDLPTETILAVEADADLADALSDEYGFCVFSFDHEQISW